jgi:Protein of unknown function (DUF3375)
VQHGLAELVAYLELATDNPRTVFDEDHIERVQWQTGDGRWKTAEMPRVIFVR